MGVCPCIEFALVHERVTNFAPTFSSSAPFIAMKPLPEIVTFVGCVLLPKSGRTLVIFVAVSLVAVMPHTRAASPGMKLPA